ncbi:DUF3572 domain-containing protein [Labrenzia sp. OB1]|uniref:DUF3572 domain-containing protein n=1 Tax=Labrenzia sp. OB1 TaxID=1561204 RepID=UPI0007B1E829|nr:DUF3572 domain-containing protein [Labrenzia sp. OB1]KZM50286.1 hypothetical protein OA90_10295 [Labrenzia sp. OB1]
MKNLQAKSLSVEEAQGIATEALLQLSRDPEQIGRFLAMSGIGPEVIREAAEEPGFLAGVLEFYMMDEALLLAFCENAGVRPTMMAAARYALAGGQEDHA